MSLIDRANTTVASKIKQYEIVARPGTIKLKAEGADFNSWLEEQANHCNEMGLTYVLKLGPANYDASHETHDLFQTETSILSSYVQVALDQLIMLSNERFVATGTTAEIEKMK